MLTLPVEEAKNFLVSDERVKIRYIIDKLEGSVGLRMRASFMKMRNFLENPNIHAEKREREKFAWTFESMAGSLPDAGFQRLVFQNLIRLSKTSNKFTKMARFSWSKRKESVFSSFISFFAIISFSIFSCPRFSTNQKNRAKNLNSEKTSKKTSNRNTSFWPLAATWWRMMWIFKWKTIRRFMRRSCWNSFEGDLSFTFETPVVMNLRWRLSRTLMCIFRIWKQPLMVAEVLPSLTAIATIKDRENRRNYRSFWQARKNKPKSWTRAYIFSGLRRENLEKMQPTIIEKNGFKLLFCRLAKFSIAMTIRKPALLFCTDKKSEKSLLLQIAEMPNKSLRYFCFDLASCWSRIRICGKRAKKRLVSSTRWGRNRYYLLLRIRMLCKLGKKFRHKNTEAKSSIKIAENGLSSKFFMYSMGNFISGQRMRLNFENPDHWREYTAMRFWYNCNSKNWRSVTWWFFGKNLSSVRVSIERWFGNATIYPSFYRKSFNPKKKKPIIKLASSLCENICHLEFLKRKSSRKIYYST